MSAAIEHLRTRQLLGLMVQGARDEKVAKAFEVLGEALNGHDFSVNETLLGLGLLIGHVVAANPMATDLPLRAVLEYARDASRMARDQGGAVTARPMGSLQ